MYNVCPSDVHYKTSKKMSSNVTLAAPRRAEKVVVEKYEKILKAPKDPFWSHKPAV